MPTKGPTQNSFAPRSAVLVVIALELGGCWSHEAANFARLLARSRLPSVAPALRSAYAAAFVTVGLPSLPLQRLALTGPASWPSHPRCGPSAEVSEVLASHRGAAALPVSRLPPRVWAPLTCGVLRRAWHWDRVNNRKKGPLGEKTISLSLMDTCCL